MRYSFQPSFFGNEFSCMCGALGKFLGGGGRGEDLLRLFFPLPCLDGMGFVFLPLPTVTFLFLASFRNLSDRACFFEAFCCAFVAISRYWLHFCVQLEGKVRRTRRWEKADIMVGIIFCVVFSFLLAFGVHLCGGDWRSPLRPHPVVL